MHLSSFPEVIVPGWAGMLLLEREWGRVTIRCSSITAAQNRTVTVEAMKDTRFGIDFAARTAGFVDGLGVGQEMRNDQDFWWQVTGK